MTTPTQLFQRMLPTARILWAGLVASTLLVAVFAFLVQPDAPAPLAPTLELVLAAMAVAAAVASFVLPGIVATSNARHVDVGPANQLTGAVARFADPQRAVRQAMAVGQTCLILSMALSEVPSLLGLVLHMLGAPTAHVVPFLVTGTLLSAIRLPTIASLITPFERACGARFADSVEPAP